MNNSLDGYAIDHLGVAVRSLDTAKKFYIMLGLPILREEVVEHERVRVAMVPVGETRIELLEPTSDDSVIARFLAKRGEGLHHVALRVPELAATVDRLKAEGARFVSEELKVGAGGHLYCFVHPASTGGVLVELCEDPPQGV